MGSQETLGSSKRLDDVTIAVSTAMVFHFILFKNGHYNAENDNNEHCEG
jgi:hypothetical protein